MYSKLFGSDRASSNPIINKDKLLKKFKSDLHNSIFQTCRYYDQIKNEPLDCEVENEVSLTHLSEVQKSLGESIASNINEYLDSKGQEGSRLAYENGSLVLKDDTKLSDDRKRIFKLDKRLMENRIKDIAQKIVDTHQTVYSMHFVEKILNGVFLGTTFIGLSTAIVGVSIDFGTAMAHVGDQEDISEDTPEDIATDEKIEGIEYRIGNTLSVLGASVFGIGAGLFGATQWWFGSKSSRVEKEFKGLVEETERALRDLEKAIIPSQQQARYI
jgi:hypothetical protein